MPTSEVITLPYARISFPRLDNPKSFIEGQEPRYEAAFLLDPTHKGHAKVIAQIKATAGRLCKEHWAGKIPKGIQTCFGDNGNGKEYDGYEGMFVISTAKVQSDGRPTVQNANGDPVQAGDDQFPYAGCYVHATLSLWTSQHPVGGKRISANLRAVRFARAGAAFSSVAPVDPDTEFDDLDDGDFDDSPLAGEVGETDDLLGTGSTTVVDDEDDDLPF